MQTDGEPARPGLAPRVPGQKPVQRASSRAVTAVLVAIVVFLYLVRQILLPFVIAGVIAFVCTPLIDRLAHALRAPRWVAATAVCGAVTAIAAGLAYLAVPTLLREIQSTVSNLQPTIERAVQAALGTGHIKLLGQETDAAQIAAQLLDAARGALGRMEVVAGVAFGGFAAALGLIMTFVLFIYFMVSGPAVAKGLLWLVPPKQRPLVAAIWTELDPVLFRYFAGLAIVVVYATMAAYLGLALVLHLPDAAVLAVVTGLLEIVPVVGPAASALFVGLFAVHAAADAKAIVAYVIYAVTLRLSIDQLVSPLVLGRAGRVHPVVIIFSFLAGGVLFGIAGIILAIPVALAIKTVLAALYEEPIVPHQVPADEGAG